MYDEFAKEFEEDIQKRTKAENIVQLMSNVNFSFETALKALEIPQEDYNDYAELIQHFYPDVMKTQ